MIYFIKNSSSPVTKIICHLSYPVVEIINFEYTENNFILCPLHISLYNKSSCFIPLYFAVKSVFKSFHLAQCRQNVVAP